MRGHRAEKPSTEHEVQSRPESRDMINTTTKTSGADRISTKWICRTATQGRNNEAVTYVSKNGGCSGLQFAWAASLPFALGVEHLRFVQTSLLKCTFDARMSKLFTPFWAAAVSALVAANVVVAAPIPDKGSTDAFVDGHWHFPGTGGTLQFGMPVVDDISSQRNGLEAYDLQFGVAGEAAIESPPSQVTACPESSPGSFLVEW